MKENKYTTRVESNRIPPGHFSSDCWSCQKIPGSPFKIKYTERASDPTNQQTNQPTTHPLLIGEVGNPQPFKPAANMLQNQVNPHDCLANYTEKLRLIVETSCWDLSHNFSKFSYIFFKEDICVCHTQESQQSLYWKVSSDTSEASKQCKWTTSKRPGSSNQPKQSNAPQSPPLLFILGCCYFHRNRKRSLENSATLVLLRIPRTCWVSANSGSLGSTPPRSFWGLLRPLEY